MQCDYLCHVIPVAMASASCDTTSVSTSITLELMLLASSLAPMHCLRPDNWIVVQQDFFHHVMPLVVTMASHAPDDIINAPLYSLGKDNWNEVWHDILVMWCHCLWHHDTNGIISGTWPDASTSSSTDTKSLSTSKQSSYHDKCNGVTEVTFSIMWQKTRNYHVCANN